MSGRIEIAKEKNTKKSWKSPDWWDFIWIFYSRNNRQYWIQFAIVYLIFVAIYAGMVMAKSRRQSYALLAALTLLGIYYFPFNQGADGMFIYVAAFVPFATESLAICLGTFGLMVAIIMTEAYFHHMSPWAWGFGSVFTLIVGGTNLFTAQRVRANSKLQMAQEEIEQLAKVAERERIARDLHDVLGHTLSVIVLKSELAGRLFSRNPERAAAEIADVETIARTALSEVREAIRGYRAEGLAAEILRAHSVLDAAGVTLVCEDVPPALNPTEESVLSLVLREAVTNIVRHARATTCRLRFITEAGHRQLVVEDDGQHATAREGNGLRGMRERVESVGGHFSLERGIAQERGTRLIIELPFRGATAS
jgi:two-component system sensor histidine kinase DesK